jgi:hypothetical protein
MGHLTDVTSRIVNGHPNSDIDPSWIYRKQNIKAIAQRRHLRLTPQGGLHPSPDGYITQSFAETSLDQTFYGRIN